MTEGGIRLSLRVAAAEAERDAAIGEWLQSPHADPAAGRRAILAEGVLFDRDGPQDVPLVGLGAGCPCCIGSVALRVSLTRTLRTFRPHAVLLLLSSAEHLPRLRRLLADGGIGLRFEIDG